MVDYSALAERIDFQAHRQTTGDELKVEYQRSRYDAVDQVMVYSGNVRAVYGLTTILCDELRIDQKNKTGVAKGRVQVIDPDGTLDAEDLEFSYAEGAQKGSAKGVRIQIGRMKLRADKVDIEGRVWTLHGLRATPSRQSPPEFELRARRVVLTPGKGGRANGFGFDLWGWNLGAVPYITFSLDSRVTGFRLPAIAFQRGQGVGVGWGSTFLLNEQTSITGKMVSLPKQFPSYTLEVAGSSIAPEQMIGRLTTRNDLQERLNDSYFDSILVPTPGREVRALRSPRSTWSAGSYWNQATRGRLADSEQISKPWDLAYELGGPLGRRGGYLAQARLQSIRGSAKDSDTVRLTNQFIAHSGWYPVAKGLTAGARVDADSFGEYGWMRLAGALRWSVDPKFDLTGGAATTADWGKARFAFDRPFNNELAFLRGDLRLGSITGVGLVKYDLSRSEVTDVEYGLSLVAGSFEPYFNYRQYPRSLQFGIRLRVADFFEALADRNLGRRDSSSRTQQR